LKYVMFQQYNVQPQRTYPMLKWIQLELSKATP